VYYNNKMYGHHCQHSVRLSLQFHDTFICLEMLTSVYLLFIVGVKLT